VSTQDGTTGQTAARNEQPKRGEKPIASMMLPLQVAKKKNVLDAVRVACLVEMLRREARWGGLDVDRRREERNRETI